MTPRSEAEAPDLADWVAAAAALQGLSLDPTLLDEVVSFVAVARAMRLQLPDGDEAP